MIGWLVALVLYGLGGVWMLRCLHDDPELGRPSRGALRYALVVAALWPAVVVWGEVGEWVRR